MNRTRKTKILIDLINGRPGPLESLYHNRERDPVKMSNEQLRAEIERCHKKVFQETGVMPPPTPDYAAMSVDELQALRDAKRRYNHEQSRKNSLANQDCTG